MPFISKFSDREIPFQGPGGEEIRSQRHLDETLASLHKVWSVTGDNKFEPFASHDPSADHRTDPETAKAAYDKYLGILKDKG